MGSEQVSERWDPSEYQKGGIWVSIGKVGSWQVQERWDPGKYRKGKILVSTGKGRIRASTENEGIWVSTGKVGREGRNLGEYRER